MKLKQAIKKTQTRQLKQSRLNVITGDHNIKPLSKEQLAIAICETTYSYGWQSTFKLVKDQAKNVIDLSRRPQDPAKLQVLNQAEAKRAVFAALMQEGNLIGDKLRRLLKLTQAQLVDKLEAQTEEKMFRRYQVRLEEANLRDRKIKQPRPALPKGEYRDLEIDKRRLGRAKKYSDQDIRRQNAQRRAKKARATIRHKQFAKERRALTTPKSYLAQVKSLRAYLGTAPDRANF